MRIQHNIMAMSAYRNYTNNVSAMKKNLEKLSSGYKINRAGDDAAGLAISEKMRAQITGLETAQKNAKDGISLVQTAEGALTEVHDMLNRMVELATMSANGTYDNTTDRAQLQKEMDQLRDEINRIADSSNFNGIKLLDGSMSTGVANPIEIDSTTVTESAKTNVIAATASKAGFGAIATTGASATVYEKTILHADGANVSAGTFQLDLTGLSVSAPSSGTAGLTIKIGSTSFAIKATGAKKAMTASDIATQLGKAAKFIAISSTGAITFGTKASAASVQNAANALVYQASVGSGGKITYTLYGQTAASAGKVTAITGGTTGLNNMDISVAQKLEGAAKTNLNFKVDVAKGTKGTLTDNRQNKGALQVTPTVVKAEGQLGNTVVGVNWDSIKDGTVLRIGNKAVVINTMGSKSVASSVKAQYDTDFKGSKGSAAVVLDLSKLANASTGAIASTNQKEALRQIANKLDDTGTIRVGANSQGKLTLSEAAANGVSVVSTTTNKHIIDGMRTKEDFQKLLQTWQADVVAAVNGGQTTITVDADKIFEGNAIKITASNGASTTTTTYVFTADKSKLATPASKVPANTKYVDISDRSKIVENLGKAISSSASISGDKITIAYDRANGSTVTADDFKYALATGDGVWKSNSGLKLQIGDTADDFNQLTVDIKDMHTKAMGEVDLNGVVVEGKSINDISIANQEDAADAVDIIKSAINYVSDMRGTLGATQNRLDHTINNLSVMTENIQDAESTIRDTDVAEEMMAYTKNNILIQSAQAMLAQANQVPQGVLQLLQ